MVQPENTIHLEASAVESMLAESGQKVNGQKNVDATSPPSSVAMWVS
jgi:hypothetical protein